MPGARMGGQAVKLTEGSSEAPEVGLPSSPLSDFQEREVNTAVPVCKGHSGGENGDERCNPESRGHLGGTAQVTERQKADGRETAVGVGRA